MTTKEFKRAFSVLVSHILSKEITDKDFIEFQSILGMIDTLFQEGKENDLSMVLRLHFPEYYNDYKPFEVNE